MKIQTFPTTTALSKTKNKKAVPNTTEQYHENESKTEKHKISRLLNNCETNG